MFYIPVKVYIQTDYHCNNRSVKGNPFCKNLAHDNFCENQQNSGKKPARMLRQASFLLLQKSNRVKDVEKAKILRAF